jgi:hypothetical protein
MLAVVLNCGFEQSFSSHDRPSSRCCLATARPSGRARVPETERSPRIDSKQLGNRPARRASRQRGDKRARPDRRPRDKSARPDKHRCDTPAHRAVAIFGSHPGRAFQSTWRLGTSGARRGLRLLDDLEPTNRITKSGLAHPAAVAMIRLVKHVRCKARALAEQMDDPGAKRTERG